jgi:hypothetical protein
LEEVEKKVRAYRQTAQVVENLPRQVRELWASGELREMAGMGERIEPAQDPARSQTRAGFSHQSPWNPGSRAVQSGPL